MLTTYTMPYVSSAIWPVTNDRWLETSAGQIRLFIYSGLTIVTRTTVILYREHIQKQVKKEYARQTKNSENQNNVEKKASKN